MKLKFQIITVIAIVLICGACNYSRSASKVAAFERFIQKVVELSVIAWCIDK